MNRGRRVGRVSVVLASLVLSIACGDDPTSNDAISVSTALAELTVEQAGPSASTTLTLTRSGDFEGPVTLAATGLPAGVLASISPAQLTGTTVSATLTLAAAPTAVVGTSAFTISATADGVQRATTSMSVTVMPAPDFRLSMAPTLIITAGTSGETAVNITRTNFTGQVELSLLNPPNGITGTFTPPSPTGNTSSVTIAVAPNVPPGSYPVFVTGNTTIGSRNAQVTVTVLEQTQAFTISASPAVIVMDRGNSTVVNLALGRTDFSGTINLALETPPPGVTGTIVPSTTTGNTAVLTVNVGDAVPAGIYQLRVRGTATGLIDRVAFIQLTVTIPVGADVQYLFCDPSSAPVFLAYQDGTGAWKAVAPIVNGTLTRYSFTLVQARGGVLIVYRTTSPFVSTARTAAPRRSRLTSRRSQPGLAAAVTALPAVDQYVTELLYASSTELAQDGLESCQQTLATKTVSGTFANVPGGQLAIASLGNSTNVFIGNVSTNPVEFTDLPERPLDLIGSRLAVDGGPPDRVLVARNVDAPADGMLGTLIDFAGPNSSTPVTASATLTGGAGDTFELFTDLVTGNGQGSLWFDLQPSASTVRQWGGLNLSVMAPGDLHELVAFATRTSADFRVAARYLTAVTDQTLVFGPSVQAPTTSQVVGGGYPRFRFQGPIPAEYGKGVSIDVTDAQGTGNSYSIIASRAWIAASGPTTAYDLTMPDVLSLAGFPAASRLTPGSNQALATLFGFTGTGTFDLRPSAGSEYKAAARGGTIVVP